MKFAVAVFLLLAVVNGGVQSQGLNCPKEAAECLIEAPRKNGFSPDVLGTDFKSIISNIMEKIKQLDICKFIKDFNECVAKIDMSECTIPINSELQYSLDLFRNAESQLQCHKPGAPECYMFLQKCAVDAASDSGIIEQFQNGKRMPPGMTAENFDFLKVVGKEEGCKFMKDFRACAAKDNDRCKEFQNVGKTPMKEFYDNDLCKEFQAVGESQDGMEEFYVQEHSGCASTFTSLALILASIFVLFHRKYM